MTSSVREHASSTFIDTIPMHNFFLHMRRSKSRVKKNSTGTIPPTSIDCPFVSFRSFRALSLVLQVGGIISVYWMGHFHPHLVFVVVRDNFLFPTCGSQRPDRHPPHVPHPPTSFVTNFHWGEYRLVVGNFELGFKLPKKGTHFVRRMSFRRRTSRWSRLDAPRI